MKTAKYITDLSNWRGDAKVYELSEEIGYENFDTPGTTKYVIVSAANIPYSGPETYIFPARKKGDIFEIICWIEMAGSYRGSLDHEAALEGAGYEVVSVDA